MNVPILLSAMLCLFFADAAIAQAYRNGNVAPAAEVQAPLPPPPPAKPQPQGNRPDCWPNRDIQPVNCRPRPHPYRRPVIVNPTPPQAEDTTPPSTDWEGCRQEKLKQLNALRYGDTTLANRLDEWLWKNCRSFSNELRELEQDAM